MEMTYQVSMLMTPSAQVCPFLEELTNLQILRRQSWHCVGVWLIVVWWYVVVCGVCGGG
jgi:hypothetical protein